MECVFRQATRDISTLLSHPPKTTSPILQLGDTTINCILQVANLLNNNQVISTVLMHKHQLTHRRKKKYPCRRILGT